MNRQYQVVPYFNTAPSSQAFRHTDKERAFILCNEIIQKIQVQTNKNLVNLFFFCV
jgi:hypothetical protein